MNSKPLKQSISLVLDTKGMQGPITRRSVAEEVMRIAGKECWSASDEWEAKLAYVQKEIRTQMNEAYSQEFIERNVLYVPEQYRDTFCKMSRFICISSKGGRDSDHVMTLVATKDHWEANFALKDRIVQATRASRDESRDIRDLLEMSGASCLADLFNDKAA